MNEEDRHKHTDAHPAELTPTEARQASNRTMNMRVLIFGTALAVLGGLAVAGYFYGSAQNGTPTEPAVTRQ